MNRDAHAMLGFTEPGDPGEGGLAIDSRAQRVERRAECREDLIADGLEHPAGASFYDLAHGGLIAIHHLGHLAGLTLPLLSATNDVAQEESNCSVG